MAWRKPPAPLAPPPRVVPLPVRAGRPTSDPSERIRAASSAIDLRRTSAAIACTWRQTASRQDRHSGNRWVRASHRNWTADGI